MSHVGKRQAKTWGIIIIFVLLSIACKEGAFIATPTPGSASVPIDPHLKELYQALGGQPLLGRAIAPLEIRENLQCQFTERVLMCFNPTATDANRLSLYPLGKKLGIREDNHLGIVTPSSDAKVVDGFVIYEKFQPLYDRLYGARYVGRPLTELRINPDMNRIEQYFENVGFFQDLNNPNSPVALIPYGSYLCDSGCSSRPTEYWSIVKSNMAEQPFAPRIARLGGPAILGSPLLNPQYGADNSLEQLYTNVFVYSSADSLGDVKLRPLPKLLEYVEKPLAEQISHPQLVFYEIANGLGHNVPKAFDVFIAYHGGRDLSGDPIMEVEPVVGQNLYQQCFENYCLLYDPAASESLKVRMAPLGIEYNQKNPPPAEALIQNIFSPERIFMIVSPSKPNINDNEEQVIQMMVLEEEADRPLNRVEATLMLNFSDRPKMHFSFPPTDENGISMVTIPPQKGLANGSRVSFQACLNLPSEQPICQPGSYLIWNVK